MVDDTTRPPTGGWHNSGGGPSTSARGSLSSRAGISDSDSGLDRLRLALAGIDPNGQIAVWHRELRGMHEQGGMGPERALRVASRQSRVADLLSEGVRIRADIARQVGCSERTVKSDIAALRRLLEPRVAFVEEREAA